MLGGISKHLFGAYPALLLLVILAGHQSCSARKNSVYCAPSSCGNIHNISFPFRLSTDPNSCGNKKYERTCENNRPALYWKGVKYYVQAIDYSNFTIRVVDADIQKDDCFSIPRHSLILDFSDNFYLPYYLSENTSTFVLMSCPNPIQSPLHYTVNASSCKNGSTLFNSHNMEGYSSYVLIDSSLGAIPDSCRVNLMYYTFQPKNRTNMSYIEVRDSILYGFDLSWSGACCDFLKENPCKLDTANISMYLMYCGRIIRDVGLSGSPIQIAIGFLTNRILRYLYVDVWPINTYLDAYDWIYYRSSGQLRLRFNFYKNGPNSSYIPKTISSDALSIFIILLITLLVLLVFIGIYHTLLFICGLPCLITLLVYK
ncbi:hypothetical protein NC653_007910 [Populus alba x Populus x berolinensis]|uniref:Wall-associated receptor kinase galacturonan-binding domain-containing protein n=1 Tax=Populus alba x Populus x berolinensis TaxID=444605 RepID=A0AAD6W9C3_9ROSI|nr:hypothetical protein NC653_007910 [Populus alba x Populus x berolinensis]